MRLGALALLELSAKLVYLVLLLLDHLPVVVDQLLIRPVVDGDLGVAAVVACLARGLQVLGVEKQPANCELGLMLWQVVENLVQRGPAISQT